MDRNALRAEVHNERERVAAAGKKAADPEALLTQVAALKARNKEYAAKLDAAANASAAQAKQEAAPAPAAEAPETPLAGEAPRITKRMRYGAANRNRGLPPDSE